MNNSTFMTTSNGPIIFTAQSVKLFFLSLPQHNNAKEIKMLLNAAKTPFFYLQKCISLQISKTKRNDNLYLYPSSQNAE